jgi:hypothetical protein
LYTFLITVHTIGKEALLFAGRTGNAISDNQIRGYRLNIFIQNTEELDDFYRPPVVREVKLVGYEAQMRKIRNAYKIFGG